MIKNVKLIMQYYVSVNQVVMFWRYSVYMWSNA